MFLPPSSMVPPILPLQPACIMIIHNSLDPGAGCYCWRMESRDGVIVIAAPIDDGEGTRWGWMERATRGATTPSVGCRAGLHLRGAKDGRRAIAMLVAVERASRSISVGDEYAPGAKDGPCSRYSSPSSMRRYRDRFPVSLTLRVEIRRRGAISGAVRYRPSWDGSEGLLGASEGRVDARDVA